MKKIILTIFVLTLSIGCKNSESSMDVEKLNDSISSDSTTVSDKRVEVKDSATCTIYASSGKVISKKEIELFICLPELSTTNKYVIKKVYPITANEKNGLLVHFTDQDGKDLCSNSNQCKPTKFSINIENMPEIDTKSDITTVIYHDNKISDGDLSKNVESIFTIGQTTRNCFPYAPNDPNKSNKSKNVPKVCGTGTIKP